MKRVSESSFSTSLGDLRLKIEKATLNIEDGRKAVKDQGVPNGYVDGEVGASGDIEVDVKNLEILTEAARTAGSWQQIDLLDLLFYAKGTEEEEKVEAFGCLLNLEDIINADSSSDKKAITKIKYEVCSSDFVRIGGVPYLDPARVEGLA